MSILDKLKSALSQSQTGCTPQPLDNTQPLATKNLAKVLDEPCDGQVQKLRQPTIGKSTEPAQSQSSLPKKSLTPSTLSVLSQAKPTLKGRRIKVGGEIGVIINDLSVQYYIAFDDRHEFVMKKTKHTILKES